MTNRLFNRSYVIGKILHQSVLKESFDVRAIYSKERRKIMGKIFLKGFFLWAMVFCLSLFFGISMSSAKDKIVIGVIVGLSGWGADIGAAAKEGVGLAVEEINKKGGVLGKQVEVIFRDDQSNPTAGITAVRELIYVQKVDVVIGPTYTTVAFAILPIINEAKTLHLTLGTGTAIVDPEKNPYTFRTNFYSKIEAEMVVDYAIQRKKFKKLAIFHDSSAYGKSGLAELIPLLQKEEVTPVLVESYNIGDKDMTGQLLKIKNAQPEAILAWGLGPDFAVVAKNMVTLGMDLPVYGSSGLNQLAIQQLAKDAGRNFLGVLLKSFTLNDRNPLPPSSKRYMDEVTRRYGVNRISNLPQSGVWYDSVYVYAKAVEMAKSTETEKVKATIEKSGFSYKGLNADFIYGPKDHEGVELKDLTLAYSAGMIPEGAFRRPNDLN